MTYEGLVPRIQQSFLSRDQDSLQPHIRAFVDRAVTFKACPDCGGTRLAAAARSSRIRGVNIADCLRDADQRPGGLAPRPRRAVRGAAAGGPAAHPRLVRRDRARLPEPRPAVGDALGRRGAARQDDPPHRVVAHRRHLRLRRAHHGPPPPRRPADERAAAAAARQGQHRAGGRARAGSDRDRRPRGRPRPGRRLRRRHRLLRGHGRGPAGQRHAHRTPPRRTGPGSSRGPGRRTAGSRSATRPSTTCAT